MVGRDHLMPGRAVAEVAAWRRSAVGTFARLHELGYVLSKAPGESGLTLASTSGRPLPKELIEAFLHWKPTLVEWLGRLERPAASPGSTTSKR